MKHLNVSLIIFLFFTMFLYSEETTISLDYYYLPGCRSCQEFLENTIPELEEKLSINLSINHFDILDSQNFKECEKRLKRSGFELENFPVIFAGSYILAGDEEILPKLEKILTAIMNGSQIDPISIDSSKKFSSFSIIPVFIAGLVDGINPCAFAAIVFLILTLSAAGKKGKEILIIGTSFTATVFITYFFIGLGLFTIIRQVSVYPLISRWIRLGLSVLLILFALVSLYDYFLIRKGNGRDMLLKLPKSFKNRIHDSIKVYRNTTTLTLTSVVVGFMVSIFELSCTGQIYFPTIAYMVKVEGGITNYLLLGIYNGGFILPLIVVFILTYTGVNSRKIADFFNRNLSKSKLALSGVFTVLAILNFTM